MRSSALPAAILCGALGLALAFAERRVAMVGVLVLALTASGIACITLPQSWTAAAFLGCWVSVTINSVSVYVPRCLGRGAALALSLNSGTWTGAVISLAASRRDLLIALPWSLLVLPAAWAQHEGKSIAVKVVSSWLIAIAILAAALQFLSVTPGYLPDHID